jgi:hypothetical protein
MAKDFIGYEQLTDTALRSVAREALRKVEAQGLIGGHHLYLTFKTHFPGVEIADFLKEQYPDEITIVLQNQFWGLKAGDDAFEITLTFQKVPASMRVPYAALTAFADPSAQFGLKFGGKLGTAQAKEAIRIPKTPAALPEALEQPKPEEKGEPQIVSLDKFRKK